MNLKLTYIQIEREKKNLQKFIVRLTGEAKKGQFWTILENDLGYFWNSENGSKAYFIEICQIFTQFSLNLVNESPKKIPAFIPKVVGDP